LRDEGEEEVLDRKVVLEETFKELSKALGITFKYEFYLEAEGLEGAPANNDKQYELIRRIICNCSSHLDASRVRTWTEIKDWYDQDIDKLDDETVKMKTNQLKEDLEDKLDKVEFDIADIKYPFLKSKLEKLIFLISLASSSNPSTPDILKVFEFISNFECNLSEKEYEKIKLIEQTNSNVNWEFLKIAGSVAWSNRFLFLPISILVDDLIDFLKKEMIQKKLKDLDIYRTDLREELENCKSSMKKQKEMLEEKRKTIIRLEATLVSQIQIQQQQN